jgi:hypothetical protein
VFGKTAAKALKRDYIPGGPGMSREEAEKLTWRPTMEHEVHQCGRQTGDDYPQSGPIYCGDVADFIAISPSGSVMAVCKRHATDKIRATNG